MGFFICFFIIVLISVPLIVFAAKRLFGISEANVLFPDKWTTGTGGIFLLAACGIMIFEAICYFAGGFDKILAYSFGWVTFAFGLIFIYASFRKKIIAGGVLEIKPLLFPAKQIEWKDIELAKIRNGIVFPNKTPVEKLKIYSRGKKVLAINEGYYNYSCFIEMLVKNNVPIDDYKNRKRKKKREHDNEKN